MTRYAMVISLLAALAAHAAPVMVVDTGEGEGEGEEYWLPLDESGWSVLPEPTVDTREIYVSSSEGNDTTGNGSIGAPYATLAKAATLFRNKTEWVQQPALDPVATPQVGYAYCTPDDVRWYSDWVLLKRGDTWAEDISVRRGPSPEAPVLFGAYGEGARPQVLGISKNANDNHMCSNLVVTGVAFTAPVRINNGQYWPTWCKATNILIEDCVLLTVDIQSTDNVVIRRSVVAGAYSTTTHSSGYYLYASDGSIVEDCIFDHNGWHDTITDAEPTVFNHNMYIKENCFGFTLRNTITARASASGAQLRAGGDCINNLFLDNPLALDWGFVNGSPITPGGVTGEVRDNVVLGAANLCRPRPGCADAPRGSGFQIGNVASGTISRNIISTAGVSATNNRGILLASMGSGITNPEDGVGLNSLTVSDNIVYAWDGDSVAFNVATTNCEAVVISGNTIHNTTNDWQVFKLPAGWTGVTLSDNRYWAGTKATPFTLDTDNYTYAQWVMQTGETGSSNTEPSWTAPTRSIATYMASLGYAEGDQTVEKFLELARANSKADWDVRFTADAVNDYIRAGFIEE